MFPVHQTGASLFRVTGSSSQTKSENEKYQRLERNVARTMNRRDAAEKRLSLSQEREPPGAKSRKWIARRGLSNLLQVNLKCLSPRSKHLNDALVSSAVPRIAVNPTRGPGNDYLAIGSVFKSSPRPAFLPARVPGFFRGRGRRFDRWSQKSA